MGRRVCQRKGWVMKSQSKDLLADIIDQRKEEECRMETKKRNRRKAWVEESLCVACGCCQKVCPKGAISIWKGVFAKVEEEKCVGCGKCAKECPASVIQMKEVLV